MISKVIYVGSIPATLDLLIGYWNSAYASPGQCSLVGVSLSMYTYYLAD